MARPVTFLHAADFHLGARFIGAHLRNPELGLRWRKAVQDAYDAVIDTALSKNVDFVCFAGDLFNTAESDYQAQGHFVAGLRRLEERGIAAYLVTGNHDPLDGSDRLKLPSNTHLFSTDHVEEVLFEREGVQTCALYGRSYPTAEVNSNYAQGFKRGTCENAVGILHTNVGTESAGERYARCSIDDLTAAHMDYWALGHIHLTNVLRQANPCIVYAGSPQALNINETGDHGCYVVTLDKGKVTQCAWEPIGELSMAQVSVDISSAETLADVRECALDTLRSELDAGHHYLVRLTLRGTSQLEEALDNATLEKLLASLAAAAAGPLPYVAFDTTIVNESIDSVEDEMATTTNEFLRNLFDVSPEEAYAHFNLDQALATSKKSTFSVQYPDLAARLSSFDEFKKMFSEAQELLYRQLMKEGN